MRHITIYEGQYNLFEIYYDTRHKAYRQYRGSMGRNYLFSGPSDTPEGAGLEMSAHPVSPEYLHKHIRTAKKAG